jgi:RNA ligase (TIGR02306 family)
MSRKLATIQRILEITPIEKADAIEKAKVLGWNCVIKKGMKVNDKIIYCEVDSVLPDKPEFEFLRERKFRIRTIRLRGQISQGLVLPLSYLPEGDYEDGQDVTELMGITLYQPPIPETMKGLVKGGFPSFVSKTDETRIQILQNVLDKHIGTPCYISEKIDGTSVTYFIKDGVFGVCSRNLELLETEGNLYWKIARVFDIENKLKKLEKNIAIQGEIYGHGIQENPLRIEGQKVAFFNVFDIDKFAYLDFEDFISTMDLLELESVPIICTDFILHNNIDEYVKLATRKSTISLSMKDWAEGIVIRPLKEVVSLEMSSNFNNGRLTFKVINPEYLLLHE